MNASYRKIRLLKRTIAALILVVLCGSALATEFEFPDLDGKLHRLSDYRGKWVVVNVWATWCTTCIEEIPDLKSFHTGNKVNAVVLGVNYEDIKRDRLTAFTKEYAINYPILKGNETLENRLGPLTGLPTTYLIDPHGNIAAWKEGRVVSDDIQSFSEQYSK